MRTEILQKYALLAALIGAPLFVLAKSFHAGPSFIIWSCGSLLVFFCCSLAATLFSGVTYGSGFERIERKAKPGRFWLMVGAYIFVCCVFVFGIIQGFSGYTM